MRYVAVSDEHALLEGPYFRLERTLKCEIRQKIVASVAPLVHIVLETRKVNEPITSNAQRVTLVVESLEDILDSKLPTVSGII